jgi:uncharacterized membrane-anchored protein YhcB (DUF1043 family)
MAIEVTKDTAISIPSLALVIGILVGMGLEHKITPDAPEAERRLRHVLKSPEKTDQLIKKLKQTSVAKEFLDDPEMAKNFRKLTNAVNGHLRKSMDQVIDDLKQKKDLLDATKPGNWIDKALQDKGATTSKRRS